MMCIFSAACILLLALPLLCPAGQAPFEPALSPYDRHILYQALVLFWIGIIGLIVIIVMKLKEAKRTQGMGVHQDEENAPFLD